MHRENTLGNKMKAISKLANLSREYTNHSIRATSITILDECGFEARALVATGVKLAFAAMLAKQKMASNLQCQLA